MYKYTALLAIAVLAIVAMACGVTVNFPVAEVKTGPTITDEIVVPNIDDETEPAELTIGFGAGELHLSPGADDALVSGAATYNVEDFKPQVTIDGREVRIETGDLQIDGIPSFSDNYINKWDLMLGEAPMILRINAGAYNGHIELGGLALQSLRVGDGAADVSVNFSEANKIEMDTLRYDTGASSVKLTGLANANFDKMTFKGGAGDFTLDFSGELLRDATVTVDSGLSNVAIIVPKGVSAQVFVDSGLANIDIGGEWERSGSDYVQNGEGPTLTINVDIGAGNLELRN
ncbi:MAG: toast rack family protein [Anaerolineales bacterium]|jgi:hypothetical protein